MLSDMKVPTKQVCHCIPQGEKLTFRIVAGHIREQAMHVNTEGNLVSLGREEFM